MSKPNKSRTFLLNLIVKDIKLATPTFSSLTPKSDLIKSFYVEFQENFSSFTSNINEKSDFIFDNNKVSPSSNCSTLTSNTKITNTRVASIFLLQQSKFNNAHREVEKLRDYASSLKSTTVVNKSSHWNKYKRQNNKTKTEIHRTTKVSYDIRIILEKKKSVNYSNNTNLISNKLFNNKSGKRKVSLNDLL